MIGIVVALKTEAQGVIDKIENKTTLSVAKREIVLGSLLGKKIALIISGIGKVNAATATQILIDKFGAETVINFGSCGGIKDKVNVLGYYRADKCCQYDFDLSLLDDVPVGFIQGQDDVYFKTQKGAFDFLPQASVASSDRFTAKEEDVAIVSALNCTIFDMELGAIGQTCALNGVPFYSFKGVTDVHGSNADGDTFYKNLKTVCDGFCDILLKGLKNV